MIWQEDLELLFTCIYSPIVIIYQIVNVWLPEHNINPLYSIDTKIQFLFLAFSLLIMKFSLILFTIFCIKPNFDAGRKKTWEILCKELGKKRSISLS
jgi:hypothetical protein